MARGALDRNSWRWLGREACLERVPPAGGKITEGEMGAAFSTKKWNDDKGLGETITEDGLW